MENPDPYEIIHAKNTRIAELEAENRTLTIERNGWMERAEQAEAKLAEA